MTDPALRAGETQPFQPAPPEPTPEPGPEPAATTQPVVATGVRPGSNRPRTAMWVNLALALAVAVAVGGIGFAAGRMTAPATLAAGAGGNGFRNGQLPGGGLGGSYFQGGPGGNGNGNGSPRRLFGGGASIQGTVDSSGNTLTLKLADGQTIQLSLDRTTTYHAQAAASADDVKAGATVIVRVQLNRGQGNGGAVTPSANDVTIVP
jgi:hypothetical protein